MLGEFEFINKMKSKYGLTEVGDDCAILPKDENSDMVLTTDLLIEDIDFRLQWASPEQIGHKTLAVSLSDIAAMGAQPKWAMLSVGLTEEIWKTDFAERFYAGWHSLADRFGVRLIGGDVSRSPERIVIDSIAGGEVEKGRAILRSGARAGDHIYVSGTLGGAAGGLRALTDGRDLPHLTKKQLEPEPQVPLAKQLQELGIVTAMIDISDGLSSDLHHLCDASRVGAMVKKKRLPVEPLLSQSFSIDESFDLALTGGEDFELLFTASGDIDLASVTKIGEITEDAGVVRLIDEKGSYPMLRGGFRHF